VRAWRGCMRCTAPHAPLLPFARAQVRRPWRTGTGRHEHLHRQLRIWEEPRGSVLCGSSAGTPLSCPLQCCPFCHFFPLCYVPFLGYTVHAR
jgi:hypothetical protein